MINSGMRGAGMQVMAVERLALQLVELRQNLRGHSEQKCPDQRHQRAQRAKATLPVPSRPTPTHGNSTGQDLPMRKRHLIIRRRSRCDATEMEPISYDNLVDVRMSLQRRQDSEATKETNCAKIIRFWTAFKYL